ncbi:signal transduction histidine kinase/ligand-binding sensor domain-containing protein [Duganella sp. 1224]|uniref:sensor histidine kinase n=1 Tax=Duganella sp. 1224 TaxID=2587052 RepID=UPI0015C8EC1A|nr:sensor histidine kinase [Duganella sp. 1224]NYE63411.1 signal transduction histidine kinase/ligand-binding sensor domain-containing protein [Duganella sp. 1224]
MGLFRLLLGLLCCAVMAWAHGAPAADERSYEHRRWGRAEGAPQLAFAAAQTSDGMLWFGTSDGLYSFDGLRFRLVSAVWGHPLKASNIASLLATPQGLMVGYRYGGLSLFTPGAATHYHAGRDFPLGSTVSIVARRDGAVYAATSTTIVRLDGGRWQALAHAPLPRRPLTQIDFDDDDTLWLTMWQDVYALAPGARQFHRVAGSSQNGISKVHGRIHAVQPDGGYLALAAGAPARRLALDQPAQYTDILIGGPEHSLWASRSDGIVRLGRRADGTLDPVERFGPGRGVNGSVISHLIDREGNLWLATLDGVERFRRHRLRQFDPGPERHRLNWLAQPGLGQELWYGALGAALVRQLPDGRRLATAVRSPTALYRVSPEHVWVGEQSGTLWEFHGTRTRRWAPPASLRRFPIQAIAAGPDGGLLVAVSRNGLWHVRDGVWTPDASNSTLADPTPISMLADEAGQTWLGYTNNRLGRLTAAGVRLLPATAGIELGNVTSLFAYRGRLLIGGDLGVAWMDGATARPLLAAGDERLRGISGIAADRQGDLWLHTSAGLAHLSAQALGQFWRAPQQPVAWEVFNHEDGLRGTSSKVRPLPSLALDGDGRLYYATMEGIGWLDPAHIRRNPVAPQVILESVAAGGRYYPPQAGLPLPPRTTALDIRFTAAALSIPARARLRYQLDGVDAGWREATQDRAAHYTNLTPGQYRFHVMAANEDGVWSPPVTLTFAIAPTPWQTAWFKALCAAALLLVLYLLYRWRMAAVARQAALRASIRMEGTVNERIRIARSLHDNLLQGVQALIMRCQAVLAGLPPHSDSHRLLDGTLDYAEQLLDETRDEVMALRREQHGQQLLAQLRQTLLASLPDSGSQLRFATAGAARTVRAGVAGEILYVLREAVLNSARHARATTITVSLHFGQDALLCEVGDDGQGIDAATATAGQAGHWGIVGMRERVAAIGGELAIGNGASGGTVVRLRVPAALAYQAAAAAPLSPVQG